MESKTTIDFRNPMLVRKAGMDALEKELGVVGMTYFLRQFTVGRGNYTEEREKLFEGVTMEEILEGIREIEAQKS